MHVHEWLFLLFLQGRVLSCGMDDGQEQGNYEERLKEVFDSFDASGAGSLSPEELSELCQSLHLDETTPVLQALLQNQEQLDARVRLSACPETLHLTLQPERLDARVAAVVSHIVSESEAVSRSCVCTRLREAAAALGFLFVQASSRLVSSLVQLSPPAQVSVTKTTNPANQALHVQFSVFVQKCVKFSLVCL